MKISAIEKICKESRVIRLFEVDGVQWVATGYACYPLYGLPCMTAEQMCGMFDIPEDKRGKFTLRDEDDAPSGVSFKDYDRDEQPLKQSTVSVVVDGVVLVPCLTDAGLMWIQPRLFAPFTSVKSEAGEGVTYHVRKTEDGGRYVAVKRGMSLCGLVMPYYIHSDSVVADGIRKLAAWIGGAGV